MKYLLIIGSVVLLSACAFVENVQKTESISSSKAASVNVAMTPVTSPSLPKNLPKKEAERIPEESIREVTEDADVSSKQVANSELTDRKGGITVEVSDIQKVGGNTIMMLTMDNHVYKISEMDVIGLSSLNGAKATDYQILETEMGGHHVKATIAFPGVPTGSLIVGLKPDLSFNFDLS